MTEDAKQLSRLMAEEIIERSPSLAIRVAGESGGWATLFTTENIAYYGYDKADFISGKLSWTDIVYPEDLEPTVQQMQQYDKQGIDKYNLIYRFVKADGSPVWISDDCIVIRDASGNILYYDCIIADYTETKKNIEKIEDNFRQQSVLNDILQGLHGTDINQAFQITLDRIGEYLDISRVILFEDNADRTRCTAIYEWCNHGISSMMGKGNFSLNYEHDIPEILPGLKEKGAYIVNYGEIPVHSTDEFKNEGVIAAAIFSVYLQGQPFGFICFDECIKQRYWDANTIQFLANIAKIVSNALLRRKNEQIIQNMALTDQLTGLNNRYHLETCLNKAVAKAKAQGRSGYVLFIDMDDFKIINDGYGHDYGDVILKEFANFLKSHFGDHVDIFRFGGDEFVILLQPEKAESVYTVINGLQSRAQSPWQVIDKSFYCTLSMGIVRFPEANDSSKEIIKNADIAMYQAKRMGKNNYVFYTNSLDNDSITRAEIEKNMRESIEKQFNGFSVYYQPLVSTNNQILGAEALLRWHLPDSTNIPPGHFIPLAEYLGLIIPIGEFVLRSAATLCRRINNALPDFFLSVNVSIRQFQQQNFLDRVFAIIDETGVNPANIIFEVTESMAVNDIQRMKILAGELGRKGIRLSMDDFGIGYSSLGNMRELPVDIVKIDRTFIRDITQDAYSKSFIHLVTDLVHSMGRKVCIEGVETADQLTFCRECSADYVQGFHLWRPMPLEDFQQLIAQSLHTQPASDNVTHLPATRTA